MRPDGVPVIDRIDALPGFHIASGFSGYGFGVGPGAGRLMGEIVTGRPTIVDPAPFRAFCFPALAKRSLGAYILNNIDYSEGDLWPA